MIQLGGYAAVEYCGGPEINFRMGRETAESVDSGDNWKDGLTPREIVALMGRRTLGFLPPEDEYQGRWSMNPYVFDNTYYKELLDENSPYLKLEDDKDLINDPEYREHVEEFAQDQEAFFEAFANAFSKYSERGFEDRLLSEV